MQVVNGLEEARTALRGGARALVSPPFAACHAGVGYYVALLDMLRAEFPEADFTFTVCCGDDAAVAHDALRLGLSPVVVATTAPMFATLGAIARGLDATVKSAYPRANRTKETS
ncbi:MAG: hypothetical protein WDN72_04070 [Alphaproteobacteria bacterium]